MADLQAEIELTVELRKFFNIDLFVQGYYQIRAGVKCAPRIQTSTKVEVKSEFSTSFDDGNDQRYPACVFNDFGVSKTFLIIYKNEEIQLDDQINFKLSVIVDAQNITECFNRMDLQLLVELYFIEKDFSLEKLATMQQLCSRCFKLHFNPRVGIHTHVPILFDYFHLSGLTATIHGSLLCLIPPYVFDRSQIRQTSLFSFLFGQDLSLITTEQLNPTLLDRAYQLHSFICEILLSSYESLQDYYEKMLEHLPSNRDKPIHHHQNCRQKLRNLSEKLKALDDIHTIDNLAHAHIAQCSAENIMLWCQFMETFSLDEDIGVALAREYHSRRVKRLSEGFFLRETSRINLLTNESESYNELHDLVRNSLYYTRLSHLPIECAELDGVPDTLPILIEEVYSAAEETTTTNFSSFQTSSTDGKIRPQATLDSNKFPGALLFGEKTRKTETKSSEKSPPKNVSPRFGVTHQSNRTFPFRSQSSKDTHPVVPSSSDPSVQLRIVRKLDEDSTSSSTTFSTFQSESNMKSTNRTRSSSSLTLNQNNHRSFLHRSCSTSDAQNDIRNTSPIVPDFLSTISNKPEKDETNEIVTTEQEVESTFGDSSIKSKELQKSFRGKAGTMDRRRESTNFRSLSNSSTSNVHHEKRSLVNTTKYVSTKPDGIDIIDQPPNSSLDSVLNTTLQLEQEATENIERRHTASSNDVDPLLLNGLTDHENELNLMEKTNNEDSSTMQIDDNDQIQHLTTQGNKEKNLLEYDRLQSSSTINSQIIEFVVQKEKLKQTIQSKYSLNLIFYSDLSNPTSPIPYFYPELVPYDLNGVHLIICVHGLDGNSGDLRLVRTYLELCLPACRLDFLMSSANHSSTFDDIDVMVKQLIDEIETHIDRYGLKPQRISFIGHSLGNLVIRAAVSHNRFEPYRPLLYTYLSLSGPHLGTLFNTSGLVNMGMWLMQKWKKSYSLSQMSLKDNIDLRKTYLYLLSKKPCLEYFKNIILIASPQDRYVPFHSARIEVCRAALKDTVYGSIYVEMINNLLGPIVRHPRITFVRYNAFHNIPSGTNNIIGRAAHIAILDSELFAEKLILVSAAKYFK